MDTMVMVVASVITYVRWQFNPYSTHRTTSGSGFSLLAVRCQIDFLSFGASDFEGFWGLFFSSLLSGCFRITVWGFWGC